MIGTKFEKPLQSDYIVDENGIQTPNPAPNTLSKYEEAAKWCNANNSEMQDKGGYYEVVKIPDPTPEEIAEQQLETAKAERAEAVSKIIVEVDGMKFDGDETAQTRMGRTISAAVALGVDINTYTQTWVLADNTIANPTIKQLAQALKLAGEEQTKLWTSPYEAS